MKRVNLIIALVFVSLFGLTSCGDENEVIEMINEPVSNKMSVNSDEYKDDAWD